MKRIEKVNSLVGLDLVRNNGEIFIFDKKTRLNQ